MKSRDILSYAFRGAIAGALALGAGTVLWAWTGPTASPPGNNTPTPLNISSTPQTKTGTLNLTNGLTVQNAGGAYSFITMYDDESPGGVKYIHANSNVIGFLNGTATQWLAYWDGAGNMQNYGGANFGGNVVVGSATIATNGDTYMPWKGQWLSTALNNKLDFNTWGPGSTYYATNGDMYLPWKGQWMSTALNNKLDFNTWGPGSTYYGSNGDIYMPWAGQWLSTALNNKLDVSSRSLQYTYIRTTGFQGTASCNYGDSVMTICVSWGDAQCNSGGTSVTCMHYNY